MKRFILTGAPSAGKTAVLRQLELDGFSVVEEVATDVIAVQQARGVAEPWMDPSFVDSVVELQRSRLERAAWEPVEVQFHDRSGVCTAALADFLGRAVSAKLLSELNRIKVEAVYEPRVFFLRSLGFITPTEARRISLQDAMRFERIHEETYRRLGFEIVSIEAGGLLDRVAAIKASL